MKSSLSLDINQRAADYFISQAYLLSEVNL